jgi:hypothetical protein
MEENKAASEPGGKVKLLHWTDLAIGGSPRGLAGKSGNVEISACGPLADTAAGVTSAQAVQSDGSNGQYERF